MALIVEDGSIVPGAESLVSVAEATAYHAARGSAAWAALASDELREQALRRATDYMGGVYRARWAGYRKQDDQPLDWPRYEVPRRDVGGYSYYSDTAVPLEVRQACAALALRAASGELLADQGQMKKRVKVGPIETEYSEYSPQSKRYPAIDTMLSPLFASGGTIQAVRS